MSRFMWVIFIIAAIAIGYSICQAIQPKSDTAGWVQVGIAALGIPILLRELNQIRTAISQKPIISVGLANVKDLPLSKIRWVKSLNTSLNVAQGYPHFWLVVRNSGKIAAKSIKIHLEFLSRSPKPKSLRVPVLETKDWKGDKRYTFKKANNADFVFIGGADWALHANDTDMFDFYMTTALGKKGKPGEKESPDINDYDFNCTVWTDGLDNPVTEKLTVNIVDKL